MKRMTLLGTSTFLCLALPSGVRAIPDPVAIYLFDEGSGSVAHDMSGNGNDGAIVGASWTNDTAFPGCPYRKVHPA